MTFNIEIPGTENPLSLSIEPGSSAVFVGANGSGKTRLAVFVEDKIGEKAHRISAHRALRLNPSVPKIRQAEAINKLRFGHEGEGATIEDRSIVRWNGSNPAVSMLDDFDSLLQVLFADQSSVNFDTHTKFWNESLKEKDAKKTKLQILSAIWQRLLPHRQLILSSDDIQVAVVDSSTTYSATDMSDGERAIFYLIAQALVAEESSLLIIDEPELHVHPSIMSSLWDEIEAARKDCAFLFITHDLNFAAARSAQKYVIQSYSQSPSPSWTIESVPENTGFSEEVTTLILGSRRPILFVEGAETSWEIAIYRCCYPEWTVIPRGSCEEVVHAVTTMRANAQLTRLICAGIVDADGYPPDYIQYLNSLGVFPLPVSEIENLILLPEVSRSILVLDGFDDDTLIKQKLIDLKKAVFDLKETEINDVVLRNCRRQIDLILKKIDLSNPDSVADLKKKYEEKTSNLNIEDIANDIDCKIRDALKNDDLPALLSIYDNKNLLNLAAKHLGRGRLPEFKAWFTRMLRDEIKASNLIAALKAILPKVPIDCLKEPTAS